MPGKGKGKSRGRRRSESLQWRVKYRISGSVLKKMTPAAARAKALRHFNQTGKQMKGVHIQIAWRNKDNKNPLHSNWKTSDDANQSLAAAFGTLHGSMGRAMGFDSEEDE